MNANFGELATFALAFALLLAGWATKTKADSQVRQAEALERIAEVLESWEWEE